MKHNKIFKAVTVSILGTIFAGLGGFIVNFFTNTFPKTEARVQVLESNQRRDFRYLERINDKTNRIDDKTNRIIEILMRRNEKN